MLVKIILLAVLFLLYVTIPTSANPPSNFAPEEQCGQSGGNACVLQSECETHSTLDRSLLDKCPLQKKDGAVCCKNYPVEKFNCKHLHNDCKSAKECPSKLNLGQKGCSAGTICCELV